MKIYISADIEGVCGSTNWVEADKQNSNYQEFQRQMTAEVVAACEGALAAGAHEIMIKDAHATGRNIVAAELPPKTQLIRGWSGHPYSMVQELDESFAAVLFIGYHARAGSGGSPLAHTISSSVIDYIKINDLYASEFLLHGYVATELKVPVAFLSGDDNICNEVLKMNSNINTVAVKKGIGNSTISLQPATAVNLIRDGVKSALQGDFGSCLLELPDRFVVKIRYKQQVQAFRASFYPGAELIDPQTIRFKTDRYFEVMRLKSFVI
ncbi:MAG: M55 family metallopeptidase [Candidatus Marinimicrobia bacterium]|nr:M55 family metallopeptidase [Candidatus Neomarinimicrobiota bacterium]